MSKRFNLYANACVWLLLVSVSGAQAQTSNVSVAAVDKRVKGSGTPGQLPKWTSDDTIGDSIVVETNGNIGIGTAMPGSKLTVAGRIEAFSTGVMSAVLGQSPAGAGVRGNSNSGFGVLGSSDTGNGVQGLSNGANGVFGFSLTGNGVRGDSGNGSTAGVVGFNNGSGGTGVMGQAVSGTGVRGDSDTGTGVIGTTNHNESFGVKGSNAGGGIAIFGESSNGTGVLGVSRNDFGAGVSAINTANGIGVTGQASSGLGVFGASNTGVAMLAQSSTGTGVVALGGNLAGDFIGDVSVSGTLTKGGGSFKIDHPLDPANRTLSHSFVESPDMMNIYNGNITTDYNGEATVLLPDYFAALNKDFRYQLTVIGQFAQAIIAGEISDNRFQIKTDKPSVKVSWQVTGIRQDAWANKNRIPVDQQKPDLVRGYYIHPELYDQPDEKNVQRARRPGLMKLVNEAKRMEVKVNER